ncbi:hypothetical protein [Rathayibacter sp. VKM Ac-2857]|uniref:hypothetical protein n=1 Tax=Rathayibacter sp. VKM Ac-2857 TaxID=2739020 RepID=UPI00349F605F
MDELMELAGVPKTSFYRVWASKEEFFTRLLEELVLPDEFSGAAYDPETLVIGKRVVEENLTRLAEAPGRRAVLVEAVRLAAERNYWSTVNSPKWATYNAVVATLPGLAEEEKRSRILAALRETERIFINRMAEFYDELLPVLKMRFKPGFDSHRLAAAGAAVVEGLAQRHLVNDDVVDSSLKGPGLDGKSVDWHLSAHSFLGILDSMVEPDDEEPELAH